MVESRGFLREGLSPLSDTAHSLLTAYVHPPLHDPDQLTRHLPYLRALNTLPGVTVHLGRFATNAKWRVQADPQQRTPTPLQPVQMVKVIEEEEKGSDVNLASYLLLDGFNREYDVAVVVSNDSDLAEPIRLVRRELGLHVALLNPRVKTAADLKGIATNYRVVREGHFLSSQFPSVMTDEHGTIVKPSSW